MRRLGSPLPHQAPSAAGAPPERTHAAALAATGAAFEYFTIVPLAKEGDAGRRDSLLPACCVRAVPGEEKTGSVERQLTALRDRSHQIAAICNASRRSRVPSWTPAGGGAPVPVLAA